MTRRYPPCSTPRIDRIRWTPCGECMTTISATSAPTLIRSMAKALLLILDSPSEAAVADFGRRASPAFTVIPRRCTAGEWVVQVRFRFGCGTLVAVRVLVVEDEAR